MKYTIPLQTSRERHRGLRLEDAKQPNYIVGTDSIVRQWPTCLVFCGKYLPALYCLAYCSVLIQKSVQLWDFPSRHTEQWRPIPAEVAMGRQIITYIMDGLFKAQFCGLLFLGNLSKYISERLTTVRIPAWFARAVFFPLCKSCVCLCAQSLSHVTTLCKSMDCSPPGSYVHGIFQTRILEWVAMPSSRGSS